MQLGEIYWWLDVAGGTRPVVVVSREEMNRGAYVVVVPFTSAKMGSRRKLANCIPFRAGQFGLTKDCVAQAEAVAQVRKVSIDLSSGALGRLDDEAMRDVIRAVGYVMASECEPEYG